MKINNELKIGSLFLLGFAVFSCASAPHLQSESMIYLKGQPNVDCRYLGSISSVYTGNTINQGFTGARDLLTDQSKNMNANVIKIINYNLAVTTLKLSADAYYCQDTKGLAREQNTNFFSIDPTN